LISRIADVSINTVSKLLVDASKFCADLHDREVRNVRAKRVQVDEIWSFAGAKTLRMTPAMAAGVADRLWSMDDLYQMMDAVAPKPGPRGPYKKRTVENSN
jgi:hypothetical protein